jgi:hypothetical protein
MAAEEGTDASGDGFGNLAVAVVDVPVRRVGGGHQQHEAHGRPVGVVHSQQVTIGELS